MGKIQEIIESHCFPGITGTKDGFGFKNHFYDETTNKEKGWTVKEIADLFNVHYSQIVRAKK